MQGRFKREGSAAGEPEQGGATQRGSSGGSASGGDPARSAPGSGEAPADRSATQDDPAAPAESRGPSRAGSRLALRNWRISTRLVSLIALPVMAATVLGGLRIQSSMDDIEQLDTMQLLTDMTQQATLLAAALQEERDRSAGPLVAGMSAKSDEIATARERTDDARAAFSDATNAITADDEVMRGVQATVLDISRQLTGIKEIRDEAYADPEYVSQTIMRYSDLIDALLSLSQDMAQATSNSEMIRSTRALATFSAAKEHASIQRAVITAGLARGERDGDEMGLSPSDWRYGKTHAASESAALNSFTQIYGDDVAATGLLDPLEGGIVNVVSADTYRDTVFAALDGIQRQDRSYRDWFDQDRTKIDAMNAIERTLITEMEEQARDLRNEAQQEAILNGAVVVLVLGISLVGAFVVARSMVRSLRRLQDTAQEVAHKRLPEVVRQMSEAEPEDVDTSVQSVGVHTRDEIGRVAEAFDDVHREAVRLAGEQALLRGNVNAMFTNLSRRSQGLIQRQLSLISELESREADPDQLSSLFKLDHLATRMRRNGENLLVLAGEEPGRRWTRPVPLVDVLRAAASEVEQYERIELSAVPKTDVAGRVVNDLVHLLAELLENATSFSSPQTKVKVTGHALPDGRVLVEIHDTGIGLSPEDLAEINDRLANPPTVDVSVSRRMGLFVVGRLSLRHGIRIQLRPSDSGGTTALVMLPAEVAQGNPGRTPRPGPQPGGGMPGGAPGAPGVASAPPTTTVQRETPPGGRTPGGPQAPGGPGARGRGLANLGKGPSASRGQVAGGPDRPALPSRPGNASFPATAGGPGAPAPAPAGSAAEAGRDGLTGAPGSPGAPADGGPDRTGRPSWASRVEDSGRIPVVGDQGEGPRGHEEPDTGEYARPGFTGASGPAPRPAHPAGRSAQQFDAFGGGDFRSPAQGGDPGRPGGDRPGYPGDTAEFPAVGGQDFGTGRPAADRQGPTGYTETGEFPALGQNPGRDREPQQNPGGYPADTGEFPALGQDPGRSAAPGQNPGGYPADTGEFPVMGQGAGQGRGGYPADTGEFPALGQAPEPQRYPSETGEFPVLGQPQSALPERHQPPQPAAFTDPLPGGGPHSSERTPIFEEMESTWFGTRRMEPPAPTGQQPATGTDTGAGLPVRGHPGRTDSPAAATGGDAAGDGYGATPREEFPRAAAPAAAAPQGPAPTWRPSPNDELGRQAGQLRQPSAGGVTTSGLPRRVPRANLVAGAAQQSQQQAAPTGPQVSRAPDAVRGRLTNLRRGIQQGRQANSTAGRTDRGSGPRYQ
ncbi:nitrate- and nitrite sensing domain-containing protein [Streptomyces harbinensis]|uniref:sensor histidine kinase n=1 Tax=Streptomyces harbinensis TaxID=1176198 RepID=UPI00371CFAA1